MKGWACVCLLLSPKFWALGSACLRVQHLWVIHSLSLIQVFVNRAMHAVLLSLLSGCGADKEINIMETWNAHPLDNKSYNHTVDFYVTVVVITWPFLFSVLFSTWGIRIPVGLGLDSLCNQGWLWTQNPPACLWLKYWDYQHAPLLPPPALFFETGSHVAQSAAGLLSSSDLCLSLWPLEL